MPNHKTIGVFFGGKSPEHEVSVITGIQTANNIDKEKYDVVPIYISKEGKWYSDPEFFNIETFKNLESISDNYQEYFLFINPPQSVLKPVTSGLGIFFKRSNIKIDIAFLCFHGSLGENGVFQGLFEVAEIPYTSTSVLGSALSMDKIKMKEVFLQNNIKSANYVCFYRNEWEFDRKKVFSKVEDVLKYPLFIKPSNAGSSIGVSKAHNKKELEHCIEVAVLFDRRILVEESLENTKEINISVMGNSGSDLQVSALEEVFSSSGEVLTYEDKYKNEGSKSQGIASAKRKIPAQIEKDLEEKIKETAKLAYQALDCSGLARVDFLISNETNEIYILEINTIPGSLAFYLWEGAGVSFKEMASKLIELALEKFEDSKRNTILFESNILKDFKPSLKGPKI